MNQQKLNNKIVKTILNTIITQFSEVNLNLLKSPTRKRAIVDLRHIAMIYISENTTLSYKNVADIFNRNHSTINHAKNKKETLFNTSVAKKYNILYNSIEVAISNLFSNINKQNEIEKTLLKLGFIKINNQNYKYFLDKNSVIYNFEKIKNTQDITALIIKTAITHHLKQAETKIIELLQA